MTDLDDFGVLLMFPDLSDFEPDPLFPFGVLEPDDLDDLDTSDFDEISVDLEDSSLLVLILLLALADLSGVFDGLTDAETDGPVDRKIDGDDGMDVGVYVQSRHEVSVHLLFLNILSL